MADKTIGELPAATSLWDNSMFVIEQNGHAMRTDMRQMRDQFLAGGTNNLVVKGNLATMVADATATDIFAAVDVNKGVKLYLYNPSDDSSRFVGATFAGVAYEASTEEHIAYFYTREKTSSGAWEYKTYAVGSDGSMSVYSSDTPVLANISSTITAALRLNYTPTNDLHAVNKGYVDNLVGSVSSGVSSVNSLTGDVTLDIPNISVQSGSNYTRLSIVTAQGSSTLLIPSMSCFPLVLQYDADTDTLTGGSFSDIVQARQNGQRVSAEISCGYSMFFADLTRSSNENQVEYYSFDYVTMQLGVSTELWWGSLRLYEDGTRNYREGTISMTETTPSS